MAYSFSETTLRLLHKAGWHDGYQKDTTDYQEALKKEGYPIHPSVISFLTRFGGLHVTHPHARVPDMEDWFDLDPAKAAANVSIRAIKNGYNKRVDNELCVIGEAFRGYMVLMMAPDDKVYAGYDDLMVSVGDSGEDAIEALCTGRELPEVP